VSLVDNRGMSEVSNLNSDNGNALFSSLRCRFVIGARRQYFWSKVAGASTTALELVYQADPDASCVGTRRDCEARIGGAGECVLRLVSVLDKAGCGIELGGF
jgi:hypothetical protein